MQAGHLCRLPRSSIATSLTAHSRPSLRRPMISRRRRSAMALKTSLVVAALAIPSVHNHIGICTKHYYRETPMEPCIFPPI